MLTESAVTLTCNGKVIRPTCVCLILLPYLVTGHHQSITITFSYFWTRNDHRFWISNDMSVTVILFAGLLKSYAYFLVYRTNIFIKLLKLLMLTHLYFCFVFFCGIWVFFSNHKHLLATLLRLGFMVFVLFVTVYFLSLFFDWTPPQKNKPRKLITKPTT
jgi:hypothetical protein